MTHNDYSYIADEFTGVSDNIDAACVWTGVYFFKGDQFCRWELYHVASLYLRPIWGWKGLPNYIDAAYTNVDGHTYFFKGPSFVDPTIVLLGYVPLLRYDLNYSFTSCPFLNYRLHNKHNRKSPV